MEEEFDPILERRAREAKQTKTRNLTVAAIALGIIALGLCGALYYVWNKYNGVDVRNEKANVQNELLMLRTELDDNITRANELNLRNDVLTDSLDTAKMQVDALLDRLQKQEVSSRQQLESYKKELATLRTIMRGYVTQLDSLNTLNQKLIAENKDTHKKLRESEAKNEDLTRRVEELSSQVSVGEKLKARGIEALAERRNGKKTEKARDVERLVVSFTLAANDLAQRGEMTTYVRVLDPEDILLVNASSTGFEADGQPMSATAFRRVEYAGDDLQVTIYVNDIEEYIKGIYRVEVYTDAGLLGTTTFSLR
ncbi:MAG: hypothetical protein LIQ26_05020 [Bacteroidota bacterium]|nr:hypothetical protein [Bacteroidota bacterium]